MAHARFDFPSTGFEVIKADYTLLVCVEKAIPLASQFSEFAFLIERERVDGLLRTLEGGCDDVRETFRVGSKLRFHSHSLEVLDRSSPGVCHLKQENTQSTIHRSRLLVHRRADALNPVGLLRHD